MLLHLPDTGKNKISRPNLSSSLYKYTLWQNTLQTKRNCLVKIRVKLSQVVFLKQVDEILKFQPWQKLRKNVEKTEFEK